MGSLGCFTWWGDYREAHQVPLGESAGHHSSGGESLRNLVLLVGKALEKTFCPQFLGTSPSVSGESPGHHLVSSGISLKNHLLLVGNAEHSLLSLRIFQEITFSWGKHLDTNYCLPDYGNPFLSVGNSLAHIVPSKNVGSPLLSVGNSPEITSVSEYPRKLLSVGDHRSIPSAFRIYQEIPFCQWGALDTIFSDQIPKGNHFCQ